METKKKVNIPDTFQKEKDKFDGIILATFDKQGRMNFDMDDPNQRRFIASVHTINMMSTEKAKSKIQDLKKDFMTCTCNIAIYEYARNPDSMTITNNGLEVVFKIEYVSIKSTKTFENITTDIRVTIERPIDKTLPNEICGFDVCQFITGYDEAIEKFVINLIDYAQEVAGDQELYHYKVWL